MPEAHRPFRKHRSLSGQFPDTGDDAILRTILVHEIVVGTGSYFTGEGSTGRLTVGFLGCYDIIEIGLSGIVPIKTVAFLAGEIRDGDIGIIVPEYDVLATTLIHVNITQLTQTIDGLVIGKTEVLLNAVLALVGFILAGFQMGLRIGKQQLSILRKEADFASLLVQFNGNEIRFNIYNISVFQYLNVLHLLRLQDDRIAFFLNGSPKFGIRFQDADDGWRIELDGHILLSHLTGDRLGSRTFLGACHLYALGTEFTWNANGSDAQKGNER